MTKDLLIVGVSARAAAHSALRAGWQPFAIDPFNDRDLVDRCPALRSCHFPHDIVALSSQVPVCPVMYTGALENHPAIVTALAKVRTLFGTTAESIRAVRDPWKLQQILSDHGFKMPEVRQAGELQHCDTWLRKPRHSGGGLGIRTIQEGVLSRDDTFRQTSRRSHYFQRFVRGVPMSAQYVAGNQTTQLLGVTRQLVGCDWAGAEHFMYVGNIGAVALAPTIMFQLRRLGDLLAQEFRLRGLFGVDVIVAGEELWTLEVNPRYTAAVEVVERSTGVPGIEFHVAAFEGRSLPEWKNSSSAALHGKAVLYARETSTISARFSSWVAERNSARSFAAIADIPLEGTHFKHGSPICTVFADGGDESTVIASLRALAREVYDIVNRH